VTHNSNNENEQNNSQNTINTLRYIYMRFVCVYMREEKITLVSPVLLGVKARCL